MWSRVIRESLFWMTDNANRTLKVLGKHMPKLASKWTCNMTLNFTDCCILSQLTFPACSVHAWHLIMQICVFMILNYRSEWQADKALTKWHLWVIVLHMRQDNLGHSININIYTCTEAKFMYKQVAFETITHFTSTMTMAMKYEFLMWQLVM